MKHLFVRTLVCFMLMISLLCYSALGEIPEYLNQDGAMPIVKDGSEITLRIAAVQGDSWTAKPEDHYIWAFLEKYCNVNLEVQYYKAGSWEEQRSLLFLNDELPDIIINGKFDAADLVKYGQFEGLLYPMEDLIEENAPLMKQYFDENPSIYQELKAPDGHIYAIPSIATDDVDLSVARVFINQSWLDAVGLEMPKTLEDLTAVLKAFKDADPNGDQQSNEIPYLATTTQGRVVVLTAMGINAEDSVSLYTTDDGKVTIGAMNENYVHYLEYMKMLLEEGLLDEEFYTMTDEEYNAKLSQNLVGLAQMSAPYVYMPATEQYEQYQALVPLICEYNEKRTWPLPSSINHGMFVICSDTKYPEACIRLANVFFEKNINLLAFVGPQTSESLEPQYPVDGWEAIYAAPVDGAISYTTPDGTDLWTYLNNRIGLAIQIGPNYKQSESNELVGIDLPLGNHEMFWRNSLRANVAPYEKLQAPTLFLDEADLERAKELQTPIEDYINTMEAKFIMGGEPLENINKFYEELQKRGIDEYLALYQSAYDNYLNS